MFDIGFIELCLLAVVTLLVVGPERLPKVAYEAGLWFGKLQRLIRSARMEIEREVHNYEIQQVLAEQEKELEDVKNIATEAGAELKEGMEQLAETVTQASLDDKSSDEKSTN